MPLHRYPSPQLTARFSTLSCSTTLLFGPFKQIKKMFAKKRFIATTIYLLALIGTIVVAVTTKNVPGTLAMIAVQFIALV